ncbi:MAG: 50S ribosomal protein L9 [Gammaproteobacteria bacterium]|nr:50S ribosomal protein L9 [Gammaproteobacteria bacterium]
MEVILLEKIRNFGNIGDKVKVKTGYGRNYLIPQGKAISATLANVEKYAKMKEELALAAKEALRQAEERAAKLAKLEISIPVKATEDGKLFGSVGTSVIAKAIKDAGFEVKKSEISLPQGPMRLVGEYDVALLLHSDVSVTIKVKIVPAEEK